MKPLYECPYCGKQLGRMEELGHEKPYVYVCNNTGCIGQKEAWIDDGTGKLVLKDNQPQRQ